MLKHFLSVAIVLLFSLQAQGESLEKNGLNRNEGRLACYQFIKNFHMSTSSRSSYWNFNQLPTGGSDYVYKLSKRSENQYLVIPSTRDNRNGFYLVSDKSSAWIPLPPELATGILIGEGENKKYKTDCLRFNDGDNLGGELFVTYGNYKDWTNPGTISKAEPPGADCRDAKFSELLDPVFNRAFANDLITRIQNVVRSTRGARALYVERRNRGDQSYKELESIPENALRALDSCAELLSERSDKEILDVIAQVKKSISQGNPPGNSKPGEKPAEPVVDR